MSVNKSEILFKLIPLGRKSLYIRLLSTMHAKYGCLDNADSVFEKMAGRNSVSLTTLIVRYFYIGFFLKRLLIIGCLI